MNHACPRDENQGRGPDCPIHPRSSFAVHNHGMRVNTSLHRATLCEDDACAPESFCLSRPTGELPEVLAAMGKPSRVDDPEHTWPLGWHLLLQAAGIVILGGAAVLCAFEAWKAFAK